jgi:uncharacterized membrane protein
MTVRDRLFRALLWLCVLMWTTWVGGTLFHMLVIVPTWNASPPESLRSLYIDTEYGRHIWNFFGPPWMLARNLPVLAALVAGWHLREQRWLLLFAVVFLISTVVVTLLYIYPINDILFVQAGGDLSKEEIRALANHWILADRVRFVIVVFAYLAMLRAFSLPVRKVQSQSMSNRKSHAE